MSSMTRQRLCEDLCRSERCRNSGPDPHHDAFGRRVVRIRVDGARRRHVYRPVGAVGRRRQHRVQHPTQLYRRHARAGGQPRRSGRPGTTTDATPTFSGNAGGAIGDGSTVSIDVYSGASASGSPVRTLSAFRVGGIWSVEPGTPFARRRLHRTCQPIRFRRQHGQQWREHVHRCRGPSPAAARHHAAGRQPHGPSRRSLDQRHNADLQRSGRHGAWRLNDGEASVSTAGPQPREQQSRTSRSPQTGGVGLRKLPRRFQRERTRPRRSSAMEPATAASARPTRLRSTRQHPRSV